MVQNKNRIFDLTFKLPEIFNKYRDDKNVYNEIKYEEKKNKKIDNCDKIFFDNFNKYLPKNKENKENNKLLDTFEYFGNLLKQSQDINDIDKINNVYNLLFKKDEINFDNLKKSDNENKFNEYNFDTDEAITESF